MTRPRRIQLSRQKGWRKPESAVVVARPTKWGNPFIVGTHGDAAGCVARYRRLIGADWGGSFIDMLTQPAPAHAAQMATVDHVRAHLDELRGRDLCCWCALDAPCHADVLLEMANRREGHDER
ncbi:DUF4326 domain-containing protein [Pseudooceanicola sp.]|uniref:DUF4326 domain-containing protein n=1 Tax=Pseudooceanicola sp. TaxID=1914328 RepID=UPI00405A1005